MMTSSAVFIPSSKGSRALQGREGRSSCFLHLDLMGLWFMVVPGGMLCTAASNTAHCFAVSCTSLPQGKHERQTRSTWHPFAYFWSLSNLLVSIAEQTGTVVMENPGKKNEKNGVDDVLLSPLQKRKQSKGNKGRGNGGLTYLFCWA